MPRSTEVTRGLVLERNLPADAARTDALKDVTYFSGNEPTVVDLGGITVRVVPAGAAYTSSDVSLELDDRKVLFCGDLFWNAMFPNFVDAVPSQLVALGARAQAAEASTTYVPEPRSAREASRVRPLPRDDRRNRSRGETRP